MPEFEFNIVFPPDQDFLERIDRVDHNYDKVIKSLVEYSGARLPEINTKHKNKIIASLYDAPKNFSDLSGWVLDISQIFIKPEWGFTTKTRHFGLVARVEIEDLQFNNGLPKVNIREWIENGETDFNQSGFDIMVKPEWVTQYLQSILETGNTRPTLKDF